MEPASSSATADGVPGELTASCDVRAATPADAVAGVRPRYVAWPASTQQAAALYSAAASLRLTLVPRGSGARLDWGLPPASCDLIVDTSRLDRVIEHAAGDLVVTVQAGVRLDELARVLGDAGQRLALDLPAAAGPAGTAGGAIATNVAGPLRYRYGAPRDLLIGITVVRADGTVARSGGKVVKNVAGYDLGKLFAGSLGTLGLITEATFRLHPLPGAATWISVDCAEPAQAAATVVAIADSPLAPVAIELDWPAAAAPLTVSALLEGDEASVAERAGRLREILARDSAGRDASTRSPAAGGTLLRVAFWAGELRDVLTALRRTADQLGLDPAISGAAASGVLDVVVGPDAAADSVAGFVDALRATLRRPGNGLPPARSSAVVLTAPPAVRDAVDLWGPIPSAGLMRSVKDQFDPGQLLAPGRLGGGI